MSRTATGATGKRMSFAFPEIPWHKPKSKKKDPDQENQPDTEPEEGESSE